MIWPLRRAMAIAPDRPAVAFEGVELTYAEMWDRCRRLAGGLRALGVERGDRVAVVAQNSHRYLELYQAVPGAGMVLVPLNHRHAGPELRYALADSGARVLFTDRDIGDLPDCVEQVVDAADGHEALLAGAERAEFPDDVGEDDLAGLFYTGGTTGAAKGVMLRHRSLVANAMHVQAVWPFDAETRFLLVAPMFHLAGTLAVLATVWHGARQVVMRAFDPAGLLDLVERERVTATQVVPSMLAAISEEQLARPRDVSSLRFLTFGGAPSATETLRRAHRAFPDAELMTMYGATETAPLVTAVRHVERRLDTPQARTCGQPLVGVEARIVDPDDRTPVARGEVGEVAVRGAERDGRLLGQARPDRGRAGRRLVPHGRPRPARRRGLPVPRRPGEGHDRVRRRERVLDRGRGRPVSPPGGARGGGVRRPGRALGRGGARGRGAAVGRDRGRPDRPLPGSRSPATRSPSASRSATSRCRNRAPASC